MAKTLQGITLKGSSELVAEFFSFGINSILYQRGIYPAETFTRVTKYDMSLQLTTDPKLKNYLTNVCSQGEVDEIHPGRNSLSYQTDHSHSHLLTLAGNSLD
ncbi:mitotic spindle assembly checkpoint protein MAD2A [Clarias magur]|uniref:Mitotic spindle assembly checkpoint protein MAD2A n=1 Tax=Clarias magur TaxID=1594786 RepID=A0A8J4UDN9_CLAMG|nr:mitotic spindle assembly checkpoint protein MAD2A [Clarias magur]